MPVYVSLGPSEALTSCPVYGIGTIDIPYAVGFGYNGESNLDLQYSMSLVGKQPVTLYQTGDDVEGLSLRLVSLQGNR